MKHFVAYLCLIIFSFQVLPVKELGKLLCKGTNTEEVHEYGGDSSPLKEKKDDAWKLYTSFSETDRLISFDHKVTVMLHAAENLPDGHVADILTPPPNFC